MHLLGPLNEGLGVGTHMDAWGLEMHGMGTGDAWSGRGRLEMHGVGTGDVQLLLANR